MSDSDYEEYPDILTLVETLRRAKSLLVDWFLRAFDSQCSEKDYRSWLALGFRSNTMTEIKHVLSFDWKNYDLNHHRKMIDNQDSETSHWSRDNPDLAEQYRAEALAARTALGFAESAKNVSPADIREAVAALKQRADTVTQNEVIDRK